MGLEAIRKQASAIEVATRHFFERAAARAEDAGVRQLLDDLAQAERMHEDRARELSAEKLRPQVRQVSVGGALVFLTGVLIGNL